MKYILKNVNVIDTTVTNDHILLNQDIFIAEDIIQEIKETGSKSYDGYQVYDYSGYYITPGLINLHGHLFGSGKPSKNLGKSSKSQAFLIKFIKTKFGHLIIDKMVAGHAKNSLFSGVTTFRTSGDFAYSDVRVRNKINQNKLVGPRLIVPGPAITCIGGHGDGTFGEASNDLEELKKMVIDRYNHGVDYIKITTTGGVMDAKVLGEPGEVKMTLEQTKAVCDKAHELGYIVASHVESTKGLLIALQGGVDTIEHGASHTAEITNLYLDTKAKNVLTISPALPLAMLDPSITKLGDMACYNTKVVLKGMIEGARTCLEKDIIIGLGTDQACPLVSTYNCYKELIYFHKCLGISNAHVLNIATYQNAQIINMQNLIGSISENKKADLLIMKNNPLNDLEALGDLEVVISNGKIYKNKKSKHNKKIDKQLSMCDLDKFSMIFN